MHSTRPRTLTSVALAIAAASLSACGTPGGEPAAVAARAPAIGTCTPTTHDGYVLPDDALPDGYRSDLGLMVNPGLDVGPTTARVFEHPTLPDEHVTVVTGDSDALEGLFPSDGGETRTIDGQPVRLFDATPDRPTVMAGAEGPSGPGTWRSAAIGTGGAPSDLASIVVHALHDDDLALGPIVESSDLNPLLGLQPSTTESYALDGDHDHAIDVQYVRGAPVPTADRHNWTVSVPPGECKLGKPFPITA